MSRPALFDLDRTLVRRDTASLYVRYQRDVGEVGARAQLRVAWWILQYSLGVVDAEGVAEKALADFRGRDARAMELNCEDWYRRYVRDHIAPGGRRAVAAHHRRGDLLAIVTGATRFVATPLAAELGIAHIVCTELEVSAEQRFTGRVVKPMCYATGKVVRAERLATAQGFDLSDAVFYSDSITDLPLLERVGEPVAVNPDARLRRVARRRGWPVQRW
ncbi:MAG: HAD family hydrolase [Myxococcota bacterium]